MARLNEYINGLTNEYYNIGFVDNTLDSVMRGDKVSVTWMRHPYKSWERWFADPFILDVTDNEIYVLVEEMMADTQRGRISKLTVRRSDKTLLDIKPVLALDTHLSFPAIVRKDGKVYIHPENYMSGRHNLYEYNLADDSVTFVSTLADEPLTDTVYTSAFGSDMLFTTKKPVPSGNELLIYSKEGDRYRQADTIRFNENTGRMAGNFFMYDGRIYRLAQECNRSYGHCVVIQEISRDGGRWNVSEVRRIYSDNPRMPEGLHTFNIYKDIIVTDCVGHKLPKAVREPIIAMRNGLAKIIKGGGTTVV